MERRTKMIKKKDLMEKIENLEKVVEFLCEHDGNNIIVSADCCWYGPGDTYIKYLYKNKIEKIALPYHTRNLEKTETTKNGTVLHFNDFGIKTVLLLNKEKGILTNITDFVKGKSENTSTDINVFDIKLENKEQKNNKKTTKKESK
jgi:hypothetical protein